MTCHFDADVLLPTRNVYPVYKVKESSIDADTASRLIAYFTKGATGVRTTSDTKAELTQQLVLAKRGVFLQDDNGGHWESHEGQAEEIAQLEERIRTCPEESFSAVSDMPINITFDLTYLMSDRTKRYFSSNGSYFFVTDFKGGPQLERWVLWGDAIAGEPLGTKLENVKISKESAIEAAEQVLRDLGIEDFGIAEAAKARQVAAYTTEILSEGWYITFAETYGAYTPLALIDSGYQQHGPVQIVSEEYAPEWEPERIDIYVDELGVRSFSWVGRKETVDLRNENAQLLDFEEIKEQIRNTLRIGFAWTSRLGNNFRGEIEVCKIMLAGVVIPIKNDLKHRYVVPAWYVFYKIVGEPVDTTYVFAINALDGSTIDLEHHGS